jgi:hypothetical protein
MRIRTRRVSTAYFVGAGTVVAAVVAGLGGGVLIANTVSPHSREMTKLERRMSPEPIPVTNAASEPVSYLAATEAAATKPVVVAPAPDHAEPQPVQQTEAANNSLAATQSATDGRETPAARSAGSNSPQSSAQLAAREQGASPDNALARARDVDVKRAATEKRRSERRQQWAEKRRYPRDQELRDVEQKVREETEPTQSLPTQGFAAEPVRVEMPRIRFFDSE